MNEIDHDLLMLNNTIKKYFFFTVEDRSSQKEENAKMKSDYPELQSSQVGAK